MSEIEKQKTEETNALEPKSPRKWKKWGVALGIILLLIVLLVALLPTILSTGAARNMVLNKVNSQAPGTLEVSDWSFSWTGKQTLTGITYDSPEASAKLDAIELSSGLMAILSDRQLGTISLENPVINLISPPPAPAPGEIQGGNAPSSEAGPTPSAPAPAPAPASNEPFELPAEGILKIVNASLSLDSVERLKAINIEIAFEPGKPFAIDLSALAGEGEGTITVKGQIDLPTGGAFDPATLPLDLDASIAQLDIAPILAFAAKNEGIPKGEGIINLTTKASGNPLKFSGVLTGSGLRFEGGPLNGDKPDLGNAKISFAGGLEGTDINLEKLEIRSSLVKADVSGNLNKLTVNGRVNLAEIFNQLPNTTKLKPGTTIQQGDLTLEATAGLSPANQSLVGSVKLLRLEGTMDKKPVSLSQPVIVGFDTVVTENVPRIRDLQLTSSFLNGNGQGDMENLSVHLDLNLPVAMDEVSKFIDIGEWAIKGMGGIDLKIKPGADKASVVEGTVQFQDFELSEAGLPLVTRQNIEIELGASGHLDTGKLKKVSAKWQADLSKGWVRVTDLALPDADAKTELNLGTFGLNCGLSLKQLNHLLQRFGGLPTESRVDGTMLIEVNGSMIGQQLTITSSKITGDQLRLESPESVLSEPSLVVQTAADINLEKQALQLQKAQIDFSGGTITLPALALSDWTKPLETLDGIIDARLDIGNLTKLSQPIPALEPPAAKPEGHLLANVTFSPGKPILLDSSIEDFQQPLPDGKVLSEGYIGLNAKIALAPDQESLELREVTLNSAPLSIVGNFALTDMKGEKRLLAVGQQTADMEKLSVYVKEFTGQDYKMSGKETRDFSLDLSLKGKTTPEILRTALAQASVFAGHIEVFGLEIDNLDVPLSITNGLARLSVTSKLNEGSVDLQPSINWSDEIPAIALPDESMVLEGVKLTDKLANDLLGKLHPVFKGASALEGNINLVLHDFNWPLENGPERGTFSGAIQLREVSIGASGLIDEILSVAKISEKGVELDDLDILFKCENGRITTNPIKLKAGGHKIQLSGSLGLDQTLAYTVTIPVSETLIGRNFEDYKEYLEGLEIRLPIGGTLTKPVIDRSGLQQEISRIIGQAAKNAAVAKAGNIFGDLLNKNKKDAPPEAGIPPGEVQPGEAKPSEEKPGEEKPEKPEDELQRKLEEKAGKFLKGLFD